VGIDTPAHNGSVFVSGLGSRAMIELEDRGDVKIVRMAAGKGNAINLEFASALIEALAEIERGPAKAAILTGKGSVFGVGVDLPAMVAGGPDYVRKFLPLLQRSFEQLVLFPKPIVAAVNGHAIAGGAILMLACDQRLLARGRARVGLTEVRVGVEFPTWALETVRFATPPQHFSTLVCTGRTYEPEDALTRGLVDEIVEPEHLLDRAYEIADEMAAIPASAFSATKRSVRRPLVEAARRQAALEDAALIEKWASPETLSKMAEFAARTIGRRS
jgi:enoyl-CoA hydratase